MKELRRSSDAYTKTAKMKKSKERINFYDQILEEVKETAETHAKRMAEVLRQ